MIESSIFQEIEVIEDYFKSEENEVRYQAQKYIELDTLIKTLDSIKKSLSKPLIEEKVNELFFDDDKKVVFQEGASKSKINSKELAYYLFEQNEVEKYLDVSSITQKAIIDNFDNSDELLKMFKEKDGNRAPSLKVTKLTKDDKKLFEN